MSVRRKRMKSSATKRRRKGERALCAILGSLALIVSCASYQYPKSYGGFSSTVTLSGHTGQVLDLDLSHDGRYLASAGTDDTVRIWDTETLEELGVIEGHPDDVFSVSFSPDTSFLATGCLDGAVRVYSLPEGRLIHTMKGHAETVYSVAVSHDGKLILSGGRDMTVRLWDVETGELLKVFRGHSDEVNMVAISPDSTVGYSSSKDGTVRSWYLTDDFSAGFVQKLTSSGAYSMKLSPDGKRIAYTGDERLYNKNSNNWEKTFPLYIADITPKGLPNTIRRTGHTNFAWALAWAPDGSHIVTGGTDERIFFWGLTGRKTREKVLPRAGDIWDIEYAPDGKKLYIASGSGKILVMQ